MKPRNNNVTEASTPRPRRPRAILVIKLAISIALLAWIVSQASLPDVLASMQRANFAWLSIAACLPAVGFGISSVRWRGLLRVQGVDVPWAVLFQSNFVAGFARHFLPSTIGGDAVRGYDSWRAGASKSVAATALVVDRLLGLMALATFATVSVLLPSDVTNNHPQLRVMVIAVALALLAAAWLVLIPTPRLVQGLRWTIGRFPQTIASPLDKLLTGGIAYQGKPNQLARALALSFLLQVNVVTFYYFIGQAMGLGIRYQTYFFIVPIAVIVMMAPISINAIGIREGIFVFLLGSFGVDTAKAIAFAWTELGLFLLYGVVGGLVYAFRRPPSDRDSRAGSREPKQEFECRL